jgi:hypothetical protein
MLRNTRKRLHQFFRPKNALLQFYLQADHKITEGSERAARISHIETKASSLQTPSPELEIPAAKAAGAITRACPAC